MDSHCFKLHRSYLISFKLSNVGEIFLVKSERTVCKFRKEKQIFCFVLTYPIKWAREIRKFHIAVVQQRLRNVQKRVMHMQRCFSASLNLLFFLLFAVRRCKNFLLLSSRNFATMVTSRHTSPLYLYS